jgi:sialate O-acetylesterase
VANFSAAAYFFGNQLQNTLKIPVGLINCSWSASKIEAWMSRETLSSFASVELPDVNATDFGWPAGTPTLLWNAMVNPWKGFPVKGVIWYQGEANSADPDLYRKLFPAMIAQWRTFWHQVELPFYYVQIAPWQSEGSDKFDWALFRQCQLDLMQDIPHVGMAITADAGSEKVIHPPYKIKVGERLAYWALAKTYNLQGFMYSGPVYKQCKLTEGKVEVDFDFGADGLVPENELVTGFELVDREGQIVPASAEIVNGSSVVKVWNENVPNPVEVRYCFRNFKTGNLCNNAGLPATSFKAIIK